MRTAALSLLLLLSIAVQADGLTINPNVSSGLQQAIDSGKIRAAVIGLYDNGKTRITSFGQLSRENSSAPDGSTFFEIGSISKVFTSILTQTEVDAGRLGWDDTIASHFPDVEFANEAVGAITLRELSSHSSGLPRLPDNFDPVDSFDPYAGYDREHLLAFLAALDPNELKKEFAYSNLGAGILGTIAAESVGGSYDEAVRRAVLVPLGMAESGTSVSENKSDRWARGFSEGADMPNWGGFDALAGAGALVSTVDDMLLFVEQNLHGDALQESLTAVRVPQADGATGFGWMIREGDDEPVYWHNGGTGGYASFLSISPSAGTGVVLLTSSTDYGSVTELGFAQTMGETAEQTTVDLDPFPGTYSIAPGVNLMVFVDDGQLFGRATGQGAFPLTPSEDNEFVFPTADIRIVFELGDDGQATNLTLHQGGRATPAVRTGDAVQPVKRSEIAVDAAVLQDYVGEYQLTPQIVIKVLARDGQLYAQLTGQAAYPLFAYETDNFFYKVVDAQLHFERGDDGVVAVALHQNGVQRAPRIK